MTRLRIPLTVVAGVALVAAVILGFSGSTASALITSILAGWLICLAVVSWDLLSGLTLTALTATGVSLYLTRQHLIVAQGAISICNVNETFNCDAVNQSVWSELFGIPIALFGAAFYLALAVVLFLRRRGQPRLEGALQTLLIAGIGSLLYSAFLAWISHTMGTWCLFCISLYGLNLLLFSGALLGLRGLGNIQPASEGPQPSLIDTVIGRQDRSITTAAVTGALALVVGLMVYQGQKSDMGLLTNAGPAQLAQLYHQPQEPVILDGSEPTFGRADAPFIIVEWADYGCPYCAKASAAVKELIKKNPDVQLKFKHYPISGLCNPYVEGTRHKSACPAAVATECAQRQGMFWELNDLLFKNQLYQTQEDIAFMARQIGLDMDTFNQCRADPTMLDGIQADIEHAKKVGLTGTPTFAMKGLFGDEWVMVVSRAESMEALIDAVQNGTELLPPEPEEPR